MPVPSPLAAADVALLTADAAPLMVLVRIPG
jgi:hypothetical protein